MLVYILLLLQRNKKDHPLVSSKYSSQYIQNVDNSRWKFSCRKRYSWQKDRVDEMKGWKGRNDEMS